MQRGQLIAALVAVVVIAGLLAARISRDDDTTAAAGAAADEAIADAQAPDPEPTTSDSPGPEADDDVEPAWEPERLGPAGTLRELDGWLQTDATSFEDFDGTVLIVQFWTFGCYNCHNTFPHLQGIYERWQPEGLEIIGVHAPEFDYERDPDAVAAAAVEDGVVWPIALDTEKVNFRTWQSGGRRFWPRTFVVDQEGEIRFDRIGEGAYEELERTVAHLLENGP